MKRLGKGMEALLADAVNEQGDGGAKVLEIPLDSIKANPGQPRLVFDDSSLNELSESIKEKGVIQPILVMSMGAGEYQIVAGERRFRASKLAGKITIPAIVKEYTPEDNLEIALIENIQRENLNPVEEAMAYKNLMESFGLSQEEISKKIGKNRSTVANSLRLLKLPQHILDALSLGKISAGHARAILASDPGRHEAVYQAIVGQDLNVRDAEALAKDPTWIQPTNGSPVEKEESKKSQSSEHEKSDDVRAVELIEIEEKLRFALGTKVSVRGSIHGGKIELAYYSMDDLDRLVSILGN